jgi:23S rRNA-/tRNA-specific pseudouridylate synthase
MIIGFGENYIHAFDDLVEQANALIDKYLRKHPDLKIKQFYDAEEHKVNFGPGYAPYITWNGEFLAKPFMGAVTKNDLFKEVAKKYKSLEDDDFGFFFQAMSNTVFPSENTVEENMQNLKNGFKEKYGHSMERVNVYYEDGLYMVIGKLIYKEDYSK